ncbi:hypothetical protein AW736_25565 [Termitidicoccus mucosus]|uniref:Alpha-galactosidase n=2 Tax=Termitidicoccus mucosus TaxID=1184151 RepID=A0A178ICR5_9BACT|nr:hypothetical protein AW736_25565 [Opitutaceae bacterium TSB47]
MNDYIKCIPIVAAAFLPAIGLQGAEGTPLSALDLDCVVHVRSRIAPPPKPGKTVSGNPISIGGRKFADGFGMHGISRLQIELDGRATRFTAWTGLTDDSPDPGPVWYEILGDGRMLYEGAPIKRGEAAKEINLDIKGIKSLVLAVQSPDYFNVHTAWADARISYEGEAPKAVIPPREKPYILTPPTPREPRINGAAVFGVRPGSPVLFQVASTGDGPMRFSATNLPSGLALDAATGRFSGKVARPGKYPVSVSASNALGTATREITFVVGDTLALTPPMGWNSWNCFADHVTAEDVRTTADLFVKHGLRNHGWSYINIDDFWMTRPPPDDALWEKLAERAIERGYAPLKIPGADDLPRLAGPARDGEGRINANPRFADMQGLVDHVHSLGLKIGIYSSPGPLTCGRCTGSFGHEEQDARRFAEWGFDLLKYDWCSYRFFTPPYDRISKTELQRPFIVMHEALAKQPRDIVFSMCQYGLGDSWEWGADVGANLWRTTRDIIDTWSSMSGIGFSQSELAQYTGPGRWNDPDMLVVGHVGWHAARRASRLAPDEQYTHVSLWSLLAAPLLIGCDLTKLDDFTLNLLTNDEVIAVNQDPLGRAARRVARDRNLEVWARPLADGSVAVGLFNRGELPAKVTARWDNLGIHGARVVRDLWRQQDLGSFEGEFSAEIPRHGVLLVKIRRAEKIVDKNKQGE